MRKLLRAIFSRLLRDRAFRLIAVLMMLLGASMAVINAVRISREGTVWIMDFSLFTYVTIVPVLTSLLTALFIGSDYSGGTLRNKLIAGHRRGNIYLADLIACCCAGTVFCIVFAFAQGVIGLLLGGKIQSAPTKLLLYGALSIALTFAFTALFTLIAMLCGSRAHSVAGCLLLAFMLIFLGVYITSALNEPEYLAGYSFTEGGVTVEEPETKNPNYIGGTKRKVYEFMRDFTPGGQVLEIGDMDAEKPAMLALYDAIILIVATGIGMALFRRKDLK